MLKKYAWLTGIATACFRHVLMCQKFSKKNSASSKVLITIQKNLLKLILKSNLVLNCRKGFKNCL